MLTPKQEAILAKIADEIGFEVIRDAAQIAVDELMRVQVEKHFMKDRNDFSLANRDKCAQARAITRKMYRHHADGKTYPWDVKGIKNTTKEELINFFKDIPDPAPDSDAFRTPGT